MAYVRDPSPNLSDSPLSSEPSFAYCARLRRQRHGVARLIEEGGFLRASGGFQASCSSWASGYAVAELDGLVPGHPCREMDPGHRDLSSAAAISSRWPVAMAASIAARFPFRHLLLEQPRGEIAHIVDPRAAMRVEAIVVAEQIVLVGGRACRPNRDSAWRRFFTGVTERIPLQVPILLAHGEIPACACRDQSTELRIDRIVARIEHVHVAYATDRWDPCAYAPISRSSRSRTGRSRSG